MHLKSHAVLLYAESLASVFRRAAWVKGIPIDVKHETPFHMCVGSGEIFGYWTTYPDLGVQFHVRVTLGNYHSTCPR